MLVAGVAPGMIFGCFICFHQAIRSHLTALASGDRSAPASVEALVARRNTLVRPGSRSISVEGRIYDPPTVGWIRARSTGRPFSRAGQAFHGTSVLHLLVSVHSGFRRPHGSESDHISQPVNGGLRGWESTRADELHRAWQQNWAGLTNGEGQASSRRNHRAGATVAGLQGAGQGPAEDVE